MAVGFSRYGILWLRFPEAIYSICHFYSIIELGPRVSLDCHLIGILLQLIALLTVQLGYFNIIFMFANFWLPS